MSGLDDFFNPSGSTAQSDPEADFLAREREALGADATSFGGSHSGSGVDKDFEKSASAFPDLDEDDGLGDFASAPTSSAKPLQNNGTSGHVSVTNHDDELAAFDNQFPEVEVPSSKSVPSAPIQNNGFASGSSYHQPANLFQGVPQPQEEESEFTKSWRVKQKEEIAAREEASGKKKEETIVKAQNAIDNFYKDYNSKKEVNIARNKEEEAKFKATQTEALAKGTTWERICEIVELQDSRSKTTTRSKQDLSRFKEILLSLKRDGETAPGAAGY